MGNPKLKWPVSWALPIVPCTTGAREFTEAGAQAFPGSGHQTEASEELRRLKRELEVTRQERDILKKALAIFSRAQS